MSEILGEYFGLKKGTHNFYTTFEILHFEFHFLFETYATQIIQEETDLLGISYAPFSNTYGS